MKRELFLSFLILMSTICLAQTRLDTLKKNEPNGALSLGVSFSSHGSGDLYGYVVDVGYENQFKKRLSFYNNIAFSVHSDRDFGYDLIDQPTNPDNQTKPLVFVTTGIQTTPTLFYAIVNGEKQKFKIGMGPVLRYQENSRPDFYIYSRRRDFIRENYYVIREIQPKIFTIGYKVSIDYALKLTPINRISLKAFYQNDTNGDVITGIGLAYSHKIKFF